MSIKQQVTCNGDNCKAVRDKTNHWWSLVIDKDLPYELHIRHKIIDYDSRGNLLHLCSEVCLNRAIAKYLPGVEK